MAATITEQLVRFAIETKSADIPAPALAAAKERLADVLACAVYGASQPSTHAALRYVRATGGAPTARVWGHADLTSAPAAAFVNGVAGHALEYDDTTVSVGAHLSVCLVPGAFAAAELAGASGAETLAAIAIGWECAARIGLAVVGGLMPVVGFHSNGVLGALGVSLAAARLLGLDVERARWALGLAASSASGIRKNVGTMAKHFHVGHGTGCGVQAALLASHGFEADLDVLEASATGVRLSGGQGKAGHQDFSFLRVFGGGVAQPERIVAGLGNHWELAAGRNLTRFHPGSSFLQLTVDLTVDLVRQHDVGDADVESLVVGVGPTAVALAPIGVPKDAVSALFSIPYAAAVSVLDRDSGIQQYTDEMVTRPAVRELLDRIRLEVPPDFGDSGFGDAADQAYATRVSLRLKDGRELTAEGTSTKGFPGRPLDWADLASKYRDCAARVLPPDRVDRSLDLLTRVEELADIHELSKTLQTPS